MRFNKITLNDIIDQVDLLNTINGGVSMTSVNILSQKDQFIISVHTPGIDKHAYHVEVVNNMVLVYILLKTDKNEGQKFQVPSFMRYIPLPNNANVEEIHAIHEGGTLNIIVPLDLNQNLKQRKINIDYL